MPLAARVGDPTNHPGAVGGPGVPQVLIGGVPAANMGTLYTCAFPGTPPHPPSTIISGSATVFIGGKPAARMGDKTGCGAMIIVGLLTVDIGG